jgi:hypothetical protein
VRASIEAHVHCRIAAACHDSGCCRLLVDLVALQELGAPGTFNVVFSNEHVLCSPGYIPHRSRIGQTLELTGAHLTVKAIADGSRDGDAERCHLYAAARASRDDVLIGDHWTSSIVRVLMTATLFRMTVNIWTVNPIHPATGRSQCGKPEGAITPLGELP